MIEVLSPPDGNKIAAWPAMVLHRGQRLLGQGSIKPPTPSRDHDGVATDIEPDADATTCAETTSGTTALPQRKRPRRFLDLPLEIRLQIYGWAHVANPVHEAELCPWYPTPRYSAYFLAPIMPNVFWTEGRRATTYSITAGIASASATVSALAEAEAGWREEETKPRLLSPYRPIGYIPHALLATCRQVYLETRTVPFAENEFIFVTWFSSGLSAARAFVRGLRPWQREAMRYARLEVQLRDLGDPGRLNTWAELCGFWALGLRGLRLKIELDGSAAEPVTEDAAGPWWPLGRSAPLSWTREPYRWVEGLQALTALRSLEVEIAGMEGLTDGEKVEWCAALGARLNEGREGSGRVSVVAVSRIADGGEEGKAAKTKVAVVEG